MRRPASLLLAAGVFLLAGGPGSRGMGESVYTEGNGRLRGIGYDGEEMAIGSDIVVAIAGWSSVGSLSTWDVSAARYAETNGARQWSGLIRLDGDRACRYAQAIEESDGQANIRLSVTAEADLEDLDGVYVFLRFPVEVFAGGTCEVRGANDRPLRAVAPRDMPETPHFLSSTTDKVTIADRAGEKRVEFIFDSPRAVTLQDERAWNLPRYAAIAKFSTNSFLRKGDTVAIGFSVRVTGRADHAPVRLAMDANRALYVLDGFGGSFVYGVRSPVTRFNLDTLRIAWARTQMSLADWEPENDDASPTNTNWRVLEGRDVPGSTLRQEFVMAQELQKKGIPYVISIWDLPEWMYVDPGRGREAFGRRIARGLWNEVLESIGSYLLYAKQRYGVEPDLLSFNECQQGVRVLLSAEEHRDTIKRLGVHMEGRGLKTAMLLADSASPRGTLTYTIPAMEDPEAMRYVGALAVHSWGGATPEEYAAWSDLARRIGKPLLISEVGVDADAWHTPWCLRTFDYALRELGMYQELLLHARPRGAMEWEFTSDYAIAEAVTGANGEISVVPGWRYSFIKHFSNLTPAKAKALATRSSHPRVLFTAFAGSTTNGWVHTLHVANLGAARPVALSGIPREIRSLRALLTSQDEMFKELDPVPVRRGSLRMNLPARSLLTLTTGM